MCDGNQYLQCWSVTVYLPPKGILSPILRGLNWIQDSKVQGKGSMITKCSCLTRHIFPPSLFLCTLNGLILTKLLDCILFPGSPSLLIISACEEHISYVPMQVFQVI